MKKNTILSSAILVSFLVSIMVVSPVSAATVGLVAEWNLDDSPGYVAYDTSGNSNNGMLSGGKFGNALYFDGDEDYVNILDDPSLDVIGDLTVEAWIKIEAFGTDEGWHMYVVGKDLSGERSYGIGVDLTWKYPKRPFVIIFHPSGSYKIAWGSSDLGADQWYHLAGVFNAVADQVTLYVNGVAQPSVTDTSTVNPGGADLRIGGRQYVGSRCTFNGLIDEVRISDVVRYSGASFVLQTAPFISDGNTVGLWHLDESTGTMAYDASDYENDGTIVGATWAGPTWVQGDTSEVGDHALDFDGVDDYVTVPYSTSLDVTNELIIEAMVYARSSGSMLKIACKRDSARPFYFIGVYNGKLYAGIASETEQVTVTDPDLLSSDWHHVAMVYSDSQDMLWLYLDGTQKAFASTTISLVAFEADLILGGQDYYGNLMQFFDGKIDDVRIWNTALLDVELAFTSNSNSVVQLGNTANLEVSLTDASNELEGITVEFSCDDPTLTLSDYFVVTDSYGLASITASGPVGVYTITASAETIFGDVVTDQWTLAIYDPSGGFVTGGGWINSPWGAYTEDESLTGKATFGFVSKYKKGADVPSGNTEFVFHAADFKFSSTSYDWLVIAGDKAMFKGEGEVNGETGYKFMLSATDGGKDGDDTFRIKIWDSSEVVVYDNKAGELTDETVLGGGSIIVHKK